MSEQLVFIDTERKLLRDIRVVQINGEIDYSTSGEFIEDVCLLTGKSNEPITVIISSNGGDAFAGLAIIRTIRLAQTRGIKIIGDVHGYACSMAFLILQCCDDRKMGTLDVLMAHGVTTGFSGDMKNIEAETKLLNYWHDEFANLVAKRCSGNTYGEPGFWFEVFRDNTPQWYTAVESKEMGLIDKVA